MLVLLVAGIIFTITVKSDSQVLEHAKATGLNSYETRPNYPKKPAPPPPPKRPIPIVIPRKPHLTHPNPGKPVRPPPAKNFNKGPLHKEGNKKTP